MKPIVRLSPTAIALLAASLLPLAAAGPDADQLLRQMSAKLAAANSFTFEATREVDAALLEGQAMPEKAKVVAAVQRPDKIAVRAKGRTDTRRFIADGRTLTLYDETRNHYTTLPMRTTINGLVEQLDEKFGFTPPLAEFALSNPYKDMRRQAHTVSYLGLAKTSGGFLGLGGVQCYRLGLKGKEADAELWIAVGDQLPRKLTATFHRAGQPQVRITFSKWNLTAPVNPAQFTFVPPKGAQSIEMWTPAKMQAHRERAMQAPKRKPSKQ